MSKLVAEATDSIIECVATPNVVDVPAVIRVLESFKLAVECARGAALSGFDNWLERSNVAAGYALSPERESILDDLAEAFQAGGELNRGAAIVAEPEVARLIERLRQTAQTNDSAGVVLAGTDDLNAVADALERQIAARQTTDDQLRVLSVRISTPIQQLRDVADVDRENEQLRKQVEVARTALLDIAAKNCGVPGHSVAAACGAQYIALDALDCLDKPTQSGEPLHDWAWALARMKAGKRVELPEWPSGYGIYLDENGFIAGKQDQKGHIGTQVSWFERDDWRLTGSAEGEGVKK